MIKHHLRLLIILALAAKENLASKSIRTQTFKGKITKRAGPMWRYSRVHEWSSLFLPVAPSRDKPLVQLPIHRLGTWRQRNGTRTQHYSVIITGRRPHHSPSPHLLPWQSLKSPHTPTLPSVCCHCTHLPSPSKSLHFLFPIIHE